MLWGDELRLGLGPRSIPKLGIPSFLIISDTLKDVFQSLGGDDNDDSGDFNKGNTLWYYLLCSRHCVKHRT